MEIPLNHSIENIYIQLGQYDAYAIFDFYKGTDAYQRYGATVYGTILYSPKERARLEQEIQTDPIGNNDGIIYLDGALKNEAINQQLRTEGFRAKDIQRLSTINYEPIRKAYKKDGIKQIPNTITINFNPHGIKLDSLEYKIFQMRIESGTPLIPYEYQQYMALKYAIQPNLITSEEEAQYIIDPETQEFYTDVAVKIHGYFNRKYPENEVIRRFINDSLKARQKERLAFIKKHLGIADKHFKNFKNNDPEGYNELMQVVLGFEPRAINAIGWKYAVYWDFERFIHIYLRHYKNFFISGSSKGQGTNFQYEYRDIRRLIEIVIGNHKAEIEASLSQGKPFEKYDNQGAYYNGNYYTFRIASDGRLMQFHPHDVPH